MLLVIPSSSRFLADYVSAGDALSTIVSGFARDVGYIHKSLASRGIGVVAVPAIIRKPTTTITRAP